MAIANKLFVGKIWDRKKQDRCCPIQLSPLPKTGTPIYNLQVDVNGDIIITTAIQNDPAHGTITTINTNTVVDGTKQVYIVDTSGGNITLSINPAILGNLFFDVKKKGIDANSVILSMTTGSIYADNGAELSFTFSNPGGAVSIRLDSTNAYII